MKRPVLSFHQDRCCCGIVEVHGLSSRTSAKRKLDDFFRHFIDLGREGQYFGFTYKVRYRHQPVNKFDGMNFSHIFFTGALCAKDEPEYVTDFIELLKKEDIGEVVRIPTNKNENSGHYVTPYILVVDHDKLTTATQAFINSLPLEFRPEWTEWEEHNGSKLPIETFYDND